MAGAWLRFAGHDITRNCRTSKHAGDGPKPAPRAGSPQCLATAERYEHALHHGHLAAAAGLKRARERGAARSNTGVSSVLLGLPVWCSSALFRD